MIEALRNLKSILILIVLILIVVIPTMSLYIQPSPTKKASLKIIDVDTYLATSSRGFKLVIANDGEVEINLDSIVINGSRIFTWNPGKTRLKPGEDTVADVFFYWFKGVKYNITVIGRGVNYNVSSSSIINTPLFSNKLEFNITDVYVERVNGFTRINVKYSIRSLGYSNVNIRFFTCRSYVNTSIPIYVFHDYKYMPEYTLNLTDMLIWEACRHGVNISKADWGKLEELVENRSRCILIILYPLSSINIPLLNATLPACIIDPNHSQGVADNSKYGKSLIYDWMRDQGLILVTVGSSASQPNTWILYEDGYASRNLDKYASEDACIQLTDSSRIIMSGSGGCGIYIGSKISETLGLHVWNGDWGFNIDEMIRENIKFYSYANWKLKIPIGLLNISMPCFIKVGSGGWLCLDDRFHPLPREAVVKDLVAILKHSPWSIDWYPYGWMYDNEYVSESGQNITKTGMISITIPRPEMEGKLIVSIIGYSRDDGYKYATIHRDWGIG